MGAMHWSVTTQLTAMSRASAGVCLVDASSVAWWVYEHIEGRAEGLRSGLAGVDRHMAAYLRSLERGRDSAAAYFAERAAPARGRTVRAEVGGMIYNADGCECAGPVGKRPDGPAAGRVIASSLNLPDVGEDEAAGQRAAAEAGTVLRSTSAGDRGFDTACYIELVEYTDPGGGGQRFAVLTVVGQYEYVEFGSDREAADRSYEQTVRESSEHLTEEDYWDRCDVPGVPVRSEVR